MKMTKQEVKQEHKNNDGNPEIKSRVRQLQRQYAIGQINKTVPSADVIITNPTHFSVALKYAPEKPVLPILSPKGKMILPCIFGALRKTQNRNCRVSTISARYLPYHQG